MYRIIVDESLIDKHMEAKAEKICSFGCGIHGVCYCSVNNCMENCANPEYSEHLQKNLNKKHTN